jgi:hypothetical protein
MSNHMTEPIVEDPLFMMEVNQLQFERFAQKLAQIEEENTQMKAKLLQQESAIEALKSKQVEVKTLKKEIKLLKDNLVNQCELQEEILLLKGSIAEKKEEKHDSKRELLNALIKDIIDYLAYFEENKGDIAFELRVCSFPKFYQYPISVIAIAQKYFTQFYKKALSENVYPSIGPCEIIGWAGHDQISKEKYYKTNPVYYLVAYENGKDLKKSYQISQGWSSLESDKNLIMMKHLNETETEHEIRLLTNMKKALDECYDTYCCYKYFNVQIVRS